MGFGAMEALIVLGVVVLLFGGRRLPELGNAFGRAITNFKRGLANKRMQEESIEHQKDQPTQG